MAALARDDRPMVANSLARLGASTPATVHCATYRSLLVLSSAARLFDGPLDLAAVVARISGFIVPDLADWYMLVVPHQGGDAPLVAYAHRDSARDFALGGLIARSNAPGWPPAGSMLDNALRRARVAWMPTVAGADVCGWTAGELDQLGARSAVCMPVRSGGADPGALLVVRAAGPAYDETELELMLGVGDRASMMLDAAHQYESSRTLQHSANEALVIAAHELRTPLAVLRGYTQLVQKKVQRGILSRSDLQVELARIESQSRRIDALVSRLFDCARLSSGRFDLEVRDADLCLLTRGIVEAFHVGRPERRLRVDAPGALSARVDVARIEQVICNLLENACKFSPPSADIEITVDAVVPKSVRIAVRDHGPGVPLPLRSQIFERFVKGQTLAGESGLGLGLYVSREIAELHGGTLRADYPIDGGSCFVVELPLG